MQGRIIRRVAAAAVAMLAFAGPASAQTIDQGPSRITTDATPTFTFNGEPGATFECLIEPTGAWKSCSSPYSVQLPDGDYVFSVRAKDGAGNIEPKKIITHKVPLEDIADAYHIFAAKLDNCIKPVLVPSAA